MTAENFRRSANEPILEAALENKAILDLYRLYQVLRN